MAEPETVFQANAPDPILIALGGAVMGIHEVMGLLRRKESDPDVARLLATFAVGSFIKAGGLKLTQEQGDVITAMQAEILRENGLSEPGG